MTVAETAKRIGISASKLYQLAAARRIGHYRVGGKIVFSDDDVATFMQSCRVGTATPDIPALRTRPRLRHLNLGHS
jgi:excisionase family DNA binding protein